MPHGAHIKRYIAYLREQTDIPQSIRASQAKDSEFLREISEELGVKASLRGPEFYLTDDGERVGAILEDGRRIGYWQLLAIACIAGERNGIILPNETPCTVERILRRNGIDVSLLSKSLTSLNPGFFTFKKGIIISSLSVTVKNK